MESNAQIPGQFSVSANTQRDAAAGYLLTVTVPGQLWAFVNGRFVDGKRGYTAKHWHCSAYTRGGRCTMSNFQVFAQLFGRSGLWQFTNQVDTNSADDALLQFIRMGIA